VPTAAQWSSLVNLCQHLVYKYGNLFIVGHTDLTDSTTVVGKVCPGRNLDIRKLRASVNPFGQPTEAQKPKQSIQIISSMAK
jgi:N-acetyl-anhydromuramyl-L-alanine amidase AmpD